MTETVWLLTKQEDYEGLEVHSVHGVKPTVFTLKSILNKKYANMYSDEIIRDWAYRLWDGEVYIASLFTWVLEEIELYDSPKIPN